MRNFIAFIVITVILSSCAVTNDHVYSDPLRSRSYIELELDDIKYLGETEVSYEYSRYLFIGTRIISINGEPADNSEKHYVQLPVQGGLIAGFWNALFFERNMQRALYKAYEDFGNADYLEIAATSTEIHPMFLGSRVKKTAVVKAYKYNY